MEPTFQTQEAQALSGLQPIDGVSKLTKRLKDIDDFIKKLPLPPTPSLVRDELIQLRAHYTKYLQDATALREKGLEQLRKWQKTNNNNKSSDHTISDAPTLTSNSHTIPSTNEESEKHSDFYPKSSPSSSASTILRPTIGDKGSETLKVKSSTQPQPQSHLPSVDIELMKKLQNDNANLRNEMNRYDQEIHELQLQINSYKNNELKHNAALQKLQQELAQYKQQNESKTRALEQFNNEFETYKKERYGSLERQNDMLNEQIKKLMDNNDELKMKLVELTSTNQLQKQEIEQLQMENERLNQQLSSLQIAKNPTERDADVSQDHNHSHGHDHGYDQQHSQHHEIDTSVDTANGLIPSHISNMKPEWTQAIERVLNQVNDFLSKQEHRNAKLEHEIAQVMDLIHPQNLMAYVQKSTVEEPVAEDQSYQDAEDIESLKNERDKLVNQLRWTQDQLVEYQAQAEKYKRRVAQQLEERKLMMTTLKSNIEKLVDEKEVESSKYLELCNDLEQKKSSLVNIENNYHKIVDENRERKHLLEGVLQEKLALIEEIQSTKQSFQLLTQQKESLSQTLNQLFERNDHLVEQNQVLSTKLRQVTDTMNELMMQKSELKAMLAKQQSLNPQNTTSTSRQEEKNSKNNTPRDSQETAQKYKKEGLMISEEMYADLRSKYDGLVQERISTQKQLDEFNGTVEGLTNQIIELENNNSELLLQIQQLQIQCKKYERNHQLYTNAQHVALSILGQDTTQIEANLQDKPPLSTNDMPMESSAGYAENADGTDMFGLQPAPGPDLFTALLTTLLPFLFEDKEQPVVV